MKKKKRSTKQTISQKRNWVRRMILCYTAGYKTVLNHYKDSLSYRELANIEAMIVTGTILIDNWSKSKEDE